MSKLDVLLVEDDQMTQSLLKPYLEKENFRVSIASNAREMSAFLIRNNVAALILDLGLPDEDGLVLIRQIRLVSDMPIIVITSRTDRSARYAALEMGADDYISKPFDPVELAMRLQNIIRRSGRGDSHALRQDNIFPVSIAWSIDLDSRSLKSNTGELVDLTRAEFDILAALARSPNRVLSRSQLLDSTAHFGNDPSERTIDVLIGRIRRKLDSSVIKTVPGYGYMLETP